MFTANCRLVHIHLTNYIFPSQNCITAHLPPQAHFLALSSPPPPPLNSSSFPSGSPTTTSALQVRNARVRMPEPAPSGPIAVSNDVVGSHVAYIHVKGFDTLCNYTDSAWEKRESD